MFPVLPIAIMRCGFVHCSTTLATLVLPVFGKFVAVFPFTHTPKYLMTDPANTTIATIVKNANTATALSSISGSLARLQVIMVNSNAIINQTISVVIGLISIALILLQSTHIHRCYPQCLLQRQRSLLYQPCSTNPHAYPAEAIRKKARTMY